MTVKNFKRSNLFLFTLTFLLVAWSIKTKNEPIAFLAIAFYMPFISFLKTRVDGVLVDERQEQVGAKAAQTAFRVLVPILLLSSIALLMAAGSDRFEYLTGLGMILSYITSLAVLVYALTYFYFNRETGGK